MNYACEGANGVRQGVKSLPLCKQCKLYREVDSEAELEEEVYMHRKSDPKKNTNCYLIYIHWLRLNLSSDPMSKRQFPTYTLKASAWMGNECTDFEAKGL